MGKTVLSCGLGPILLALACGESNREPNRAAPDVGGAPASAGRDGGVSADPTGDDHWSECGRIAAAPGYSSPRAVTFAPDGELLVSNAVFAAEANVSAVQGLGCSVEIRSWPAGELLSAITPDPDCDVDRLFIAPDGSRVGLVNANSLRVFDAASASLVFSANEQVASVAVMARQARVLTTPQRPWTLDAPEVVTYNDDGSVAARVRLAQLVPPIVGGGWPTLSADGGFVAASVWNDSSLLAVLWRADTGELVWQRPIQASSGTDAYFSRGSNFVFINGTTFEVATGNALWASAWGRWLYSTDRLQAPVLALAPDGQSVGGFLGYFRPSIVSAAGGLPRYLGPASLPAIPPRDSLRSLAIDAAGRTLVVVGEETLAWKLADKLEDSVPGFLGGAPYMARAEVDPEGRWVAFGGDGRGVRSLIDGHPVYLDQTAAPADPCVWMQLRFSPDARFLLSLTWDSTNQIFAVEDLETFAHPAQSVLPAGVSPGTGCRSFAFSPDASLIETSAGALDARALPSLAGLAAASTDMRKPYDDYVLSPDGASVVTSTDCTSVACQTWLRSPRYGTRLLSTLTAPFPSFSPEGDWVAAGPALEHLPSGTTATLGEASLVSIFTPSGDIIVSELDGSLVRYCRER